MATTKIWPVKGWVGQAVDYVENPEKTRNPYYGHGLYEVMLYATNPEKTERQYYVGGINCIPEIARQQMTMSKKRYGKEYGNVAFHAYQSFAPGEVTPGQAHRIGMQLAQELWGHRFEVVVATHLNTHCYHNHFLINSVSFADGRRYNDCKETYKLLRDTSDRICREHQLSVIAKPSKTRTPRNIYLAEKRGEPTLYNLIRADVDEAIAQSIVPNQFYMALDRKGYEVKRNGKYVAVRPPGKERFTRLKTLGENYTEEAIRQRILRNPPIMGVRQPAMQPRENTVRRFNGRFRDVKKISGLRALYLSYCYKMGILPKRDQSTKKLHFLLREDLRKMDELFEQTKLLCTHRIDTAEQLLLFAENVRNEMTVLTDERTSIINKLRRCKDAKKTPEYKNRRKMLTKRIVECRRELKYVGGILERSEYMKENLIKIASEKSIETVRSANRDKELGRYVR